MLRTASVKIALAGVNCCAAVVLGAGSIPAYGNTIGYNANASVSGQPELVYAAYTPLIGWLAVSNYTSGTDEFGRHYSGSARARVSMSGEDLYASASLSAGDPGAPFGFSQQAWGSSQVAFFGGGPYYVSMSIYAHGHGISTSGNGDAYGSWSVAFNDLYGGGPGLACTILLNGGDQTCNTGIVYDAGGSLGVLLQGSVTATLPEFATDDSASINYWGTFSAGPLDFYNSSGQLIGTYNFPSPTPEPGTAVTLGSSLLALALGGLRKSRLAHLLRR